MYLCRAISVMNIYILSILLTSACYSYAAENSSIKTMIVREIMKKVSNITLNSLSKVPTEKKEMVLKKIEQKLKNTAKGLVDGNKYVGFIMEEFRNKAYKKNATNEKETGKKDGGKGTKALRRGRKKEEEKTKKHRTHIKTTTPPVNRKIFDLKTKQHIIADIANKIESMAKGYLRDSQTLEEKKKVLQKIQKRIVESSKRKHMQIHNQHSELKAYTDLITQGLKLSLKRLLVKKSRRMDESGLSGEIQNVTDKDTHGSNMENINKYKIFFSEIWNETSIDPACDDKVEEICARVESLHKLACGNGKMLFLDQLCDGVSDCWDGADEKNCTHKATEKILEAMSLMKDVDQSITSKCFQPIVGGAIFTHHHKILQEMLEAQLHFLRNYKPPKYQFDETLGLELDADVESIFMKKTIGDISMTVNSLSYAFEGNLCPTHEIEKVPNNTRRSFDGESISINYSPTILNGSLRSCTCKKQFCLTDNCDSSCKRVCWQKYSLNRWECKSTTGGDSVSLNSICDGKLDCFDESDETSCTTDVLLSKYEANKLYKDLVEILSLKSLSLEYENSRSKIIAQAGLVRQMQKLILQSKVDILDVKKLRNEFFQLLVQIYMDILQTSNPEEIDNTYDFLLLLNNKMVHAMKLSHTGNENLMEPAGCYCRNNTCALLRCSRRCTATCLAEPMLTKYFCYTSNTSVAIKTVCNGKNDCPNEEDEKDCKTEICRGHHLVVLRHNLQNAAKALKGNIRGEVLNHWTSKVISTLIIAENHERPNHRKLEEVVSSVLHDLVTAFASMEENRRISSEFELKEFKDMADIVLNILKSCKN